jgi:hypothetical protein
MAQALTMLKRAVRRHGGFRGRLLLLAAGMLCAGSVACSAGPASNSAARDATGVVDSDDSPRLWVEEQGQKRVFENGDTVTAGGLQVEIYVAPFPPGRTSNIDFYLTRSGSPVGDADVTLQYDMTVMAHGPFQLIAVPTGRGHYLAPVEFAMSGDFWVNVAIDTGGDESVVNMLVRAKR